MSENTPLHVLPDANIFLEYPRLDAAEWPRVFNGRPLVFEIPVHTVTELDAKRDAARLRLRRRAQEVTTWLLRVQESGAPLQNGATVRFLSESPVSFLERGDLDRHNPDDVLIACALDFREKEPGRALLVLSEDAGVVLKARGFGLESRQPPPELRLPAELSEEEREVKRLRERVEQLELGQPRLVVRCDENPSVVSVNPFAQELEEFVEQNAQNESEQRRPSWPLSPEQEDRLSEYLEEYRAHLAELFPVVRASLRSFRVDLILENVGRGPARDIDIAVFAPDGVEFCTELPDYPNVPKPPDFRPPMQRMVDPPHLFLPDLTSLLPRLGPGIAQQLQAPLGEWHVRAAGHAEISARKLKHGMHYRLRGLFASFCEEISNFKLEWSAHVENAPEPFEGTVNFVANEERDAEGHIELLRELKDS